MKLRFFHTTDLNVQGTQVYPLGKKIFTENKEDEELFYRRKFKGKYLFENRNDRFIKSNDFDFFIAIENDEIERCRPRYIVVDKYCNGSWERYHEGKFTLNDADFDLDKCTIEIQVDTIDEYTCLLENKDVEYNMLTTSPIISTTAQKDLPYEFILCRDNCLTFACGVPDPTYWRLFHDDCNGFIAGTGQMIYTRNQNNLSVIDISNTHAIFNYGNNKNFDLINLSNGALTPLFSGGGSVDNRGATDGNFVAYGVTFTGYSPHQLRVYNISLGTYTTIATYPTSFGGPYYDFIDIKNDYVIYHIDEAALPNRRLYQYSIATGITTTIWSGAGQSFDIQYNAELFFDGNVVIYRDSLNNLRRFNCATLTNTIIASGVTPISKGAISGDHVVFYRGTTQNLYKYKISTGVLSTIATGITSIGGYSMNEKYYCFCDFTGVNSFIKYYDLDNNLYINTGYSNNVQNLAMGNSNNFIYYHDIWSGYLKKYDIALATETNFDASFGSTKMLVNNFDSCYYLNLATNIIRDYNGLENSFVQVITGITNIVNLKKNDAGQFISSNSSSPDKITIWNGTKSNENKAKIWFREIRRTICIGGVPNIPSGSGWVLESNDCGLDGTALWKRFPPVLPSSVGTIYEGTCVCGVDCIPTPPPAIDNLILIGDCNNNSQSSYWLKTVDDIIYSRNRFLEDVINNLLTLICPELNGVKSDFFQWNPDNPSALNYVTNEENQVDYLTIAQKSDIRTPNSTEAATKGILTFENIINWLKVMFNVYWYVENNYLYFEHISKIQSPIGLDLTQGKYKIWSENQRKYSYDKASMPKIEKFQFMEQDNLDFVGFPIEYKDSFGEWSFCVNNDTKDFAAEKMTTDIGLIQINPSAVDLSGFVMFANKPTGSGYSIRLDYGFISGQFKVNAALSWSVLHNNYLKYERVLKEGYMNNVFTNFETSIKIKQQDNFKIPLCCEDQFNPEDKIITNLGSGEVTEAEFDFENDKLDLKIKY